MLTALVASGANINLPTEVSSHFHSLYHLRFVIRCCTCHVMTKTNTTIPLLLASEGSVMPFYWYSVLAQISMAHLVRSLERRSLI